MAVGDIILERHKPVFAHVAKQIGVWILVRGTNKESLNCLDRPHYRERYTPKPIDCKAKTARLGPCAGLVVNPHTAQGAFNANDFRKAADLWDDVMKKGNPIRFSQRRARYSEEAAGPLKGCIKLDGKYIHADYDLKAIIIPGHESAPLSLVTDLHGVNNVRRGPKFYQVQSRVNSAMGLEMVQHGAEDEYTGHSEDSIFVFGPHGEYEELHGRLSIENWYGKFNRGTADGIYRRRVTP